MRFIIAIYCDFNVIYNASLSVVYSNNTVGISICSGSPTVYGNFATFFPPEIQITNPNTKGCSQFFNALSNPSFDPSCWPKFLQFSTDYNIPPETLENISLS